MTNNELLLELIASKFTSLMWDTLVVLTWPLFDTLLIYFEVSSTWKSKQRPIYGKL